MRKLSFRYSILLSVLLFSLLILFHSAIIVSVLVFDFAPVDFLWGGRMKTSEELLRFEFISLFVTILCLIVVLIKSGRIYLPRASTVVTVALWFMFLLFLLNTVGNMLSKTTFEKSLTIITAILAVLCVRLAIEKTKK